jgi:hypothetical protein
MEEWQRRSHRGIEALQMANLRDAPMIRRKLEQFVRLGQRGCDWLFDQHVNAGFHQLARHFKMEHSGHRY